MSQLDTAQGGRDLGGPIRDRLCSVQWKGLAQNLKRAQETVQLKFSFLIYKMGPEISESPRWVKGGLRKDIVNGNKLH